MINDIVFIPPVKKVLKRTFDESKSQAGSQKEKKRGKILFRSDGSSAISVESENKQFLEIVTEKIPTGLDKKYLSCETMKKLCVDYYGGHCTDDGEKCCEIGACVVSLCRHGNDIYLFISFSYHIGYNIPKWDI